MQLGLQLTEIHSHGDLKFIEKKSRGKLSAKLGELYKKLTPENLYTGRKTK